MIRVSEIEITFYRFVLIHLDIICFMMIRISEIESSFYLLDVRNKDVPEHWIKGQNYKNNVKKSKSTQTVPKLGIIK